jgi:hypothetical protein
MEFIVVAISPGLWLREKEPRNHLLACPFLVSFYAMARKCEQMI